MNIADWTVLISLALVIWPLAAAILAKKNGKILYGEDTIYAALVLIFGVILLGDKNLENAFWFGLTAGSLMQTSAADPFLTQRTLVYGDKRMLLFKTPIWVLFLWGISLAQLSYFYFRLDPLLNNFGIPAEFKFLTFLAVGAAYFVLFECLVKYTEWWKRKNCRHIAGYAIYAIIAEILTVAILPLLLFLIEELGPIVAGMGSGFIIAYIFVLSCSIAYKPAAKTNKLPT